MRRIGLAACAFARGGGRWVPALAACLLGLLWASSARAEYFFDFETDSGGWTATDCSAARVKCSYAKDGLWALAVKRDFPGCATLMRSVSLDIAKTPAITYSVFAPKSAGPTLKTLVFFKNKDGLWFQCVRDLPLYPGGWTRVQFDISPGSSQVQPLGHFRRWSNCAAAEMEILGIKFFSPREFRDDILVDAIEIRSAPVPREPLVLNNFQPNALAVPKFGKFELTFNINRAFANPFDPDTVEVEAEFTGPGGRTTTVAGFYYQDFARIDANIQLEACRMLEDFIPIGGGGWKVRFTPDTPGEYTYVLKVTDHSGTQTEELATQPRRFTCTPSSRRGFVRVAADKRHFEFSNGDPFYAIGHNVHSSNDASPRGLKVIGLTVPKDDEGTMGYDRMFRRMAANGENMAEVWMSSWGCDIEWTGRWKNYFGLGRYNLHHAWKLDRILALAEKYDIRIQLVLENHGKISTFCDPEWKDSPYNESNGGLLENCVDFFRRLDVREQYKKKLRYIIARWGYSPQIMGIELVSELDLVGNAWADHPNPDVISAKSVWHREITDYIKKIDSGRHLLTTHYSTNYERVQPEMATLPSIDYIALDAYRGKGNSIVPLLHATYQALKHYNKPILVTEFGGSPFGTELDCLEADLHSGIWGGYMMNFAGSPMLWWFMFIDLYDKYPHFRALANFAEGEDVRGRGLETVQPPVSGPTDAARWVNALALKNRTAAYVWVYDLRASVQMPSDQNAVEIVNVVLSLNELKPGTYEIEFWDTYKGKVIDRMTKTVAAGGLTVPLPAFKKDIALKVKPASAASNGGDGGPSGDKTEDPAR